MEDHHEDMKHRVSATQGLFDDMTAPYKDTAIRFILSSYRTSYTYGHHFASNLRNTVASLVNPHVARLAVHNEVVGFRVETANFAQVGSLRTLLQRPQQGWGRRLRRPGNDICKNVVEIRHFGNGSGKCKVQMHIFCGLVARSTICIEVDSFLSLNIR